MYAKIKILNVAVPYCCRGLKNNWSLKSYQYLNISKFQYFKMVAMLLIDIVYNTIPIDELDQDAVHFYYIVLLLFGILK